MADDTANLKITVDSKETLKAESNLDNLTEAAIEAEAATERLGTTGAKTAKGGMSKIRTAAGQIGFQVQDMAVQLQAGTSALTVFGQQGSQIASIFGPTGAIVGGIIAIGSALGSVLITSLSETTEELEKASKATEDFNKRIDELSANLRSTQAAQVEADLVAVQSRIKAIQEEIEKTPNIALIREAELRKLYQVQSLLVEQQAILNEPNDDDSNRFIEERRKSIERYIEALELEADTLGKTRTEIELEKVARLGGNEVDRVKIKTLLEIIDTYEKEQESIRKSAEFDRQRGQSLTDLIINLKRQADATKKTRGEIEAERAAMLGADKVTQQYIKDLVDATDASNKLEKANADLSKSAQKIIDEFNPVSAEIREIEKQIETLETAIARGLIDDDLEALATLDALKTKLGEVGEEGGMTFAEGFIDATESIGDTLGNAIASGDWDGVGRDIGGTFATALGQQVSSGVSSLLSGLGSFAGPIGGLVGGLVGGLLGGLGTNEIVDPTEERQSTQGTGDVLGDIDEKADSLVTSLDIVADATSQLVNINTGMLMALEGVDRSIEGFSTSFAESSFAEIASFGSKDIRSRAGRFGLESFTREQLGEADLLDRITNEVVSAIGSGRLRVLDKGVEIIGSSVAEALDGTLVEAFVDVSRRRTFRSDKLTSVAVDLGADVSNEFTSVLVDIVDTIAKGAESLGFDSSAIDEALEKTLIEASKISLENLSFEEVTAEFQSLFGGIFNDLAANTIPFLEDLRKGGEELGETLARVSTSFELSKEAVQILGFQVAETMGDVIPETILQFVPLGESISQASVPTSLLVQAADLLVERTGGIQAFTSALSTFERNFLDIDTQIANSGRRINTALAEVGQQLPETRQGFADLFTELEALDYADNNAIATLLKLQPEIIAYYDLMERRNEELESQVDDTANAIDILTESLAELEGATDTAFSALQAAVRVERDEITTAYRDAVTERKESARAEIDVIKAIGKTEVDILKSSGKAEIDTIKAIEKARLKAIFSSKDVIKDIEKQRLNGVRIALDAAKDGLRDITREVDGITSAIEKLQGKATSQEARRIRAFEQLQTAVATGNFSGAGIAAGIAADINAEDFGVAEDFRRQVGLTSTLLAQAEASGSLQKSAAERSIEALEANREAIKADTAAQIEALDAQSERIKENADRQLESSKENTNRQIEESKQNTAAAIEAAEDILERDLEEMESNHEETMRQLDQIIIDAQSQLDELRNIDSSVKSVEGAVAAFGLAINAERQARQQLENAIAEASREEETPPEVPVPPSAFDFRKGITLDPINPNIIGVPAFANGGDFAGGARLVGENGPEVELTGSARIMSNYDSRKALNQDELISQVARMREDLVSILVNMGFDIKTVVKRINRWEGDGLPNFREIQEVEVV